MPANSKCQHKSKYKYDCLSCGETHCEKCYTPDALWSSHSVCPQCDKLVDNYDGCPINDDYFHAKCLVEYLQYEHPPLQRYISDLKRQIETLQGNRDRAQSDK